MKTHHLFGSKSSDSDITTQYNKTELSYAKTAKSTVIVQPKDAPILHERMNILELTVKNIESKLEEMNNLIPLK